MIVLICNELYGKTSRDQATFLFNKIPIWTLRLVIFGLIISECAIINKKWN